LQDFDGLCVPVVRFKAFSEKNGELCITAKDSFDLVLRECDQTHARQEWLLHPKGFLKSKFFDANAKCIKFLGPEKLVKLRKCANNKGFKWGIDLDNTIYSKKDNDYVLIPGGNNNIPWKENQITTINLSENFKFMYAKWETMKLYVTATPSSIPSMAPSSTELPSVSFMPSSNPTISSEPSAVPSSEPSLSPTVVCLQANSTIDSSLSKCICDYGFASYKSGGHQLENESDLCTKVVQYQARVTKHGKLCMTTSKDMTDLTLKLAQCDKFDKRQYWLKHEDGYLKSLYFTYDGFIGTDVYKETVLNENGLCITLIQGSEDIELTNCRENSRLKWKIKSSNLQSLSDPNFILAPGGDYHGPWPGNYIMALNKNNEFNKNNARWLERRIFMTAVPTSAPTTFQPSSIPSFTNKPSIVPTVQCTQSNAVFDVSVSKCFCKFGYVSYDTGTLLLSNHSDICVRNKKFQAKFSNNGEICLTVKDDFNLVYRTCKPRDQSQQWLHHPKGFLKSRYLVNTGMCMKLMSSSNMQVKLQLCQDHISFQWELDSYQNILSLQNTNLILGAAGTYHVPWPENRIVVINKKKNNFNLEYVEWLDQIYYVTDAPTTSPLPNPSSVPSVSSYPSTKPSFRPSTNPTLSPSQSPSIELICLQSNSYPDITTSKCICAIGFASYESGTRVLDDENDICVEMISIRTMRTKYGVLCITATNDFETLVIQPCKDSNPKQEFLYHPLGYLKSNFHHNKCVKMHLDGFEVILEDCKDWKIFVWNFDPFNHVNSEYDRDYVLAPNGKYHEPWNGNGITVTDKTKLVSVPENNIKWLKMKKNLTLPTSEPTSMPSYALTCPKHALIDTTISPSKCYCEGGYVPFDISNDKYLDERDDICAPIKQIKAKNNIYGDLCITLDVASSELNLQECNYLNPKQQWLFHPSGIVKSNYYVKETTFCLKSVSEFSNVTAGACMKNSAFKWNFDSKSNIISQFNETLILAPRDENYDIIPSPGSAITTVDKRKNFDQLNSRWDFNIICSDGYFSYESGEKVLVNDDDTCVENYQLQARNKVISKLCMTVTHDRAVVLRECDSMFLSQQWLYHPAGYLKSNYYKNESICLKLTVGKRMVEVLSCKKLKSFKWIFDSFSNMKSNANQKLKVVPGSKNTQPFKEYSIDVINPKTDKLKIKSKWITKQIFN